MSVPIKVIKPIKFIKDIRTISSLIKDHRQIACETRLRNSGVDDMLAMAIFNGGLRVTNRRKRRLKAWV